MTGRLEPIHRDVVSYVRRSARMNETQQRAWDRYQERWVVPVPSGARATSIAAEARLDWPTLFGRNAPICVEIGSGTGQALVALAEAMPEANLVAFEVFQPAVASTLSRLARHEIENVRIVMADGNQGLATLFEPKSVQEIWMFFPDPWHKKRHHKRRLLSAEFAALVADRLQPGGVFRLATDWSDYAEASLTVLQQTPGLTNQYQGWAPRFALRTTTKYEQRGISAGRQIFDLAFAATPERP